MWVFSDPAGEWYLEGGQSIGETRPDHQRKKTENKTNQTKTLSIE